MGKAKYVPGMRLGKYECPDGNVGILFLERLSSSYGMFECPICHQPFKAQVGSIINGRAHACKEHARFPYVEGQRIGDFTNPDGTVGMVFVKRVYDNDDKPTSYGEFICPVSGEHFNAEIKAVKSGMTRTAPQYAHTKYFPGQLLGDYIDKNDGTHYGVRFVRRIDKVMGVFECHYCHEEYETRIVSVVNGTSASCLSCYHKMQRKYRDGDRIGDRHNSDGTIGTKLLHYDNTNRFKAVFECPECHNTYVDSISAVENDRNYICPECDLKLNANRRRMAHVSPEYREQLRKKKEPKNPYTIVNGQRVKYLDMFEPERGFRGYGPKNKVRWLSGQRFGHLTALYPVDGYKGNFAVWMCRCDCGNTCLRTEYALLHNRGEMTSCGCVVRRVHDEKLEHDYTGQQFGNLTVLKKIGVFDGYMRYRCKCECETPCDDNLCTVRSDSLLAGQTLKPGCIKSFGEQAIKKALNQLHISFKPQAIFKSLINPRTNRYLVCDFYLPSKNMVIEFDGKQHYQGQHRWGAEMRVTESMYYDKLKNDWCVDHGITMVRIPYCYRDDINKEFMRHVIDDAQGKKLVMLPLKNAKEDERMDIMHQMLANAIAAVAEQKRNQ